MPGSRSGGPVDQWLEMRPPLQRAHFHGPRLARLLPLVPLAAARRLSGAAGGQPFPTDAATSEASSSCPPKTLTSSAGADWDTSLGQDDTACFRRKVHLGRVDTTTRERVICSNGNIPDTVLTAALIHVRHYKSLCKSDQEGEIFVCTSQYSLEAKNGFKHPVTSHVERKHSFAPTLSFHHRLTSKQSQPIYAHTINVEQVLILVVTWILRWTGGKHSR